MDYKIIRRTLFCFTFVFLVVSYAAPILAQSKEGMPDEEIFFDWEDSKNRRGQYSALTDMHQVAVFTNEFTALVKQYQESERYQKEEIFALIMNQDQKERSFDESFYLVLYSQTDRTRHKELSETDGRVSKDHIIVIMGIVLAMLISFFMLMEIKKRNRNKEGNYEDDRDGYTVEF